MRSPRSTRFGRRMCGCSAAGSHGRCAAPRLTGTAQSDKTPLLLLLAVGRKLTSLEAHFTAHGPGAPAALAQTHAPAVARTRDDCAVLVPAATAGGPGQLCAVNAPGATCTFVGPNACAPRSCPRPSPTACARWRSGWRSSAARYARPRPAPAGSHAPPRSCAQLTRAAQRRNRRRLASASQASPRDWPAAGNRRRGVPRRVRAEHAGAHG